ncbi:MAG: acetyl-CoA carboxylase, carboxyltransferase subunit beta [Spirochaetaceae bacterium]|jgi:acetyl-CoA carboxylase carboxyl transferase subunit beta|nr:acetyl-CoA carboxylase, carboxyltransferase subunit beta [Spirochaetaceae bacterium]
MKQELYACPSCGEKHEAGAVSAALHCCPACGHHFRMEPADRIKYIADENSFMEFSQHLYSRNPIDIFGYEEKLSEAESKTNMKDAVITGICEINSRKVILALMSFDFMGGSMGSVVGEKITRALLRGAEERLPVIIYATSGGARMQEGVFSLMQMAKTSSAVAEIDKAGVPYFIVLCDPATGGVVASFAMLADIIMAEPGALIGFAGPRVIEGTIRENLPEGFQRAEFQLKCGFVDIIVPRSDQKEMLSKLLEMHRL